jgi:hypothetical protein
MPTVDQQLSAVFNAWLPFIFAVVAITGPAAVAIWRVMEWRYREQYEKTKALYEIVISHAQHAAEAASRTEADLKSTNASRDEEIQGLNNLLQQLQAQQQAPSEGFLAGLADGLGDLAKSSSKTKDQLVKLGQANNAVSEALSDSRRLLSWTTTSCPICGEEAEDLPSTGDFQSIDCPKHNEFEISGTAMSIRGGGRASPISWERALKRAKRRAESGKRPRILDSDFPFRPAKWPAAKR